MNTVEQMGAPAPEQQPQDPAVLHQEVVDAQAAFDEQMQANAELTRKIEAEHYAKAYVDAQENLHADPEQMPFGEEEVRNASGWNAKVHVVAHRAGEEAVAEHRRGIQAEQERSERERAFNQSREADDWDMSVAIMDTVRERAEAADLADPSNPNNWREFDSMYSQLRSGEGIAYTHHVDQSKAANANATTPEDEPPQPPPAKPEETPADPVANAEGSGDEDDDAGDNSTPPPPQPPRPPRPHPDPADDDGNKPPRQTRPVPPQGTRADGRQDARFPLRGFQTWTETELDEAKARANGEQVPEHARLLESDYFHQIEDLDVEGLELIDLIAQTNHTFNNGGNVPQNVLDRMNELEAILNGRNPGQVDKLVAVYSVGGEFENPDGTVNSTRLTPADAEFIHLLHEYKGNERNDRIRRQIREAYERIHASEGQIPRNWLRMPDGTFEPVYGAHVRNKADWLIDRHAGARHHAVFELISEGGMEAAIGNPERTRRRLGQAALKYSGINLLRRRLGR